MATDTLDHSVTEALRAWSTQHGAGLGIADALSTCAPVCSGRAEQKCFMEASRRASAGEGIERLLDALSPMLSTAERAAIAAGWKSGRVEPVMEIVIAQRELWARSRAQVRSRMLLPLLTLLLAALVSPLPRFLSGSGDSMDYLLSVALPLGIAFGLWQAGAYLMRARARQRNGPISRTPAPPSKLDNLLLSLPIAGEIEKQRNLSEFASLLSVLLGAGVHITEALEICAHAIGNGVYREEAAQCVAAVKKGNSIGSTLVPGKLWPKEFIGALQIGEKSGTMDDVLARLSKNARERYTAAISMLADWLPRMAYGVVACFMIYNIFKMVGGIATQYHNIGM